MLKKSIIILNIFTITFFCSQASAWNEATHMLLSEYAADSSNLRKCLNSTDVDCGYLYNLGFAKGLDQVIKFDNKEQEAFKWVREGAYFEDAGSTTQGIAGTARYINHFHNPLKPWEAAGLDDWFVFHYTGESSLLWAQDSTKQSGWLGGDWTWQAIRTFFYNALTKNTDAERQAYFAQTFKGLGYQLHLIQDIGQPDHVRNDAHPVDGAGLAMGLETWTKNKFKTVTDLKNYFQNFALTPQIPTISTDPSAYSLDPSYYNKNLTPVALFFDTDQYNGAAPSASLLQGLAEYTNANFVSDDTIFTEALPTDDRHYFPYPRKTSTNIQELQNQTLLPETIIAQDGVAEPSFYIKKNADGEMINHFVKPRYFTNNVYSIVGGGGYLYNRTFYRDETCHEDYAEKLLPRAVGYSAGLLNYFFRGDIQLSLPDSGVYAEAANIYGGFSTMTVKAKNTTANGDEMIDGDIQLVLRYREALRDPFLDTPVTKSSTYSYIVSALNTSTHAIPKDSAVEVTFNLETPLPYNATDITIQVVYHGRLGNEDGAVAVGYKDISEPTPVDIYNDMGMTCLYQNWYTAGSPEAIAQVDTNGDGIAGTTEWDVYPHNLEVYIRFSPPNSLPENRDASPTAFNFHVPLIAGAPAAENRSRIPAVISDYTYHTSFYFIQSPTDSNDQWQHAPWIYNRSTTAIKNQTEYSPATGQYTDTQPNLCFYRDAKMWFDAGGIILNSVYPINTSCSFTEVITCP